MAEQRSNHPPAGIGERNEGSLHAALKQWYALPGDRLETKVDGFVVDIVRDDLLIEIQTGNFSALKRKLDHLLPKYRVLVSYPVAERKWITRLSNDAVTLSRRKSPKAGNVYDLFDQLVRIPALINHPNFILELLIIEVEEIRCLDGQGSWRRQGVSIRDRRLLEVRNRIRFETKEDFWAILPQDLGEPFTNKVLAQKAGISRGRAGKATYCLGKMGLIQVARRDKNGYHYVRTGNEPPC